MADNAVMYDEKALEWVGGSDLGYTIWNNKYRVNNESFDEWVDRVSGHDSDIARLIRERKFLFGGRILAGRGVQQNGRHVTYSNCYVIDPPEDNIESIFDCAKKLARTYSFGGGCGTDLGKLAPRGAKVHNAAKETSGAVSFMDLYSLVTGLIGQGGRRGALMLSMPVNHPDIEEFIGVKADLNRVTKANISVRITDEFMKAVEEDREFECSFTREATGETITKVVNAKELFHKMAEMNWSMAEPGMLFWDTIERNSYLNKFPTFKFAGTNPCAEEPLPAGGSCLLSSINLSEYVLRSNPNLPAAFDFAAFVSDIEVIVRAMNDVLDEGLPLHPLEEQRNSVHDWRQIGIGVMGLGDLLVKMEIRYGSREAIELCGKIGHALANEAAYTSASLAVSRGCFPKCDMSYLKESTMFQQLDSEVRKHISYCGGMLNSQLLTCAPTGSISTMLGISGGIEPIFANYYTRKTESLNDTDTYYKVYTPIVKEYMDRHGITDDADLPEWFITAPEIDPHERVLMQASWQNWIDASISSTVNLPEDTTVEQVESIYMDAWKHELKGITIYRANCARTGILVKDEKESDDVQKEETVSEPATKEEVLERGMIEDVPDGLTYRKYKLTTGCGTMYLFVGIDENENKIYDVFTDVGHNGCVVNTHAVSRLISTCIRGGISVDYVIRQLSRAGVCPSWQLSKGKGKDMSDGYSCASSIAAMLRKVQNELAAYEAEEEIEEEPEVVYDDEEQQMDVCPECGKKALIHDGGCVSCVSCGYSRCG